MNKLRKLYEQLRKAQKALRQAENERYARLEDYKKTKTRHQKQRTALWTALAQNKSPEKILERLRAAKRAYATADDLLSNAEKAEAKAREKMTECYKAFLALAEEA